MDPQTNPLPAQAARKPMYEDHHDCGSVMLGRVRNLHHLTQLPSPSQFKWLHRFYLVVDRVVEVHKVYKLFGGPQGFMVSTNVAEPDADHATTLYRFILHLLSHLQHLHLPGGFPLDLVLAVESGPMGSGLLGTTSLTYQVLGRPVAIVTELVEMQPEMKLMVGGEFYRQLSASVTQASNLRKVGDYELTSAPGSVAVYAPPQIQEERLYSSAELGVAQRAKQALPSAAPGKAGEGAAPTAAVALPSPQGTEGASLPTAMAAACAVTGEELLSLPALHAAEPDSEPSTPRTAPAAPELPPPVPPQPQQRRPQQALSDTGGDFGAAAQARLAAAPVNPTVASLRAEESEALFDSADADTSDFVPFDPKTAFLKDPVLRYVDPQMEERYHRQQVKAQMQSDTVWTVVGLVLGLAHYLTVRAPGSSAVLWQLLQLSLAPVGMVWLWRASPEWYHRFRDDVWMWHRVFAMAACCLSATLGPAGATWHMPYRLCGLFFEAVARRLRFHVQLASSVLLHLIGLFAVGMQSSGPAGGLQVSADAMLLHFLMLVLLPCVLAYGWDAYARKAFEAKELSRLKQLKQA